MQTQRHHRAELAGAFQHRHQLGVEHAECYQYDQYDVHERIAGHVRLDRLAQTRLQLVPVTQQGGFVTAQQCRDTGLQRFDVLDVLRAHGQAVAATLHCENLLKIREVDLGQCAIEIRDARLEDADHPDDSGRERIVETAADESQLVTRFNLEVACQHRADDYFSGRAGFEVSSLFDQAGQSRYQWFVRRIDTDNLQPVGALFARSQGEAGGAGANAFEAQFAPQARRRRGDVIDCVTHFRLVEVARMLQL